MTGSYVVKFSVPNSLSKSQLRLRFEGVDSGFNVWLNGIELGYSQGARNPSEFDITNAVQEGENTLAVRVYQWTDGSYIEDQGKSSSLPAKFGLFLRIQISGGFREYLGMYSCWRFRQIISRTSKLKLCLINTTPTQP